MSAYRSARRTRGRKASGVGRAVQDDAPVPLEGTQQWKTAAFDLPDPRFEGRQNGGADFRIATDAELYVRRVAVRRSAPASPPAPPPEKPRNEGKEVK